MPLTVEQILEETRQWPREKLGELVSALSENLHGAAPNPAIEEAWKSEVRRRLADIEAGRAQIVDGDRVSARIREIVGR